MEQQEEMEVMGENVRNEEKPSDEETQSTSSNKELEALKVQLEEKSKKCSEYFDMLQRSAAEFENYKRRTAREKEGIYSEAISDTVANFLPVVDNLERAIQASSGSAVEDQCLREGIDLVYRQLKDVMKKLGVEEIKSVGEAFNPELHNAVMHVEDETVGDNVIVEEFQKGYTIKDKVIRHSMVKVAN